jgi:hypothetical protein
MSLAWKYEFKVMRCPTELVHLDGVDRWRVHVPDVQRILQEQANAKFHLQAESTVRPQGVLVFKRSMQVTDTDRVEAVRAELVTYWKEGTAIMDRLSVVEMGQLIAAVLDYSA